MPWGFNSGKHNAKRLRIEIQAYSVCMFAILRTGGRLTGTKFSTMVTIKRSAGLGGHWPTSALLHACFGQHVAPQAERGLGLRSKSGYHTAAEAVALRALPDICADRSKSGTKALS